ncbi:MAG: hypothetical protein J6S67_14540 [Methanobrevibacter sp.]|nr:hypothetical protein [Methanobrevibacter sp.]
MIGQVFEKEGKKYIVPMKDIFYYARFYEIPIYFQPEENEMIGRNWFYNFLLYWIVIPFVLLFGSNEFAVKIEHRTITRQEIE